MTLDKILSPEGRWITFGGSRHKYYIKQGLMSIPKDARLMLQQGDKPDRWAVYDLKIPDKNKDDKNS
jgi:hypothetical protein